VERAYALWRAFQDRLLAPAAALILLGCTLLALLEVVRRYVFGVSYEWQQDAVTYFLLTAVFLYFGISQRKGTHLIVDVFLHAVRTTGPRARRLVEYVEVAAILVAFVFMLGVGFMAVSLFFQSWRGIQKLRGRTVLVEPGEGYHDMVD
jgi:TRAP-type C4-dicarboxylate transport system permease small subunit